MAIQTFTSGQVLTAAQVNALQANDYNQTVSTKTASYVLAAADKGTKIVMNSASATTITVNTSLFAAGDTLTLLNIGAGVCTITAGTATVSTTSTLALVQNAGGTLYFTSAGVSVFQGSAVAPSATWTSYTPVIKGGATTVTATLEYAKYCQIGKLVFVQVRATATSNGSAGAWTISAPSGLDPLVQSSTRTVGNFLCYILGNFYHGHCIAQNNLFQGMAQGANDYMGQNSPVQTLSTGNIVAMSAFYEVA